MSIGEEEERLANLYVASWNLHSSLELREVVSTIFEICQNLVGAARTSFYVHDEDRAVFELVRMSGTGDSGPPVVRMGEGAVGQAAQEGRVRVGEEEGVPPVIIPLAASGRILGVVVIEQLLDQKAGVSSLDRDLFDLLGRQGGLALYGAFLAGTAARKVTAQEFRARLEG